LRPRPTSGFAIFLSKGVSAATVLQFDGGSLEASANSLKNKRYCELSRKSTLKSTKVVIQWSLKLAELRLEGCSSTFRDTTADQLPASSPPHHSQGQYISERSYVTSCTTLPSQALTPPEHQLSVRSGQQTEVFRRFHTVNVNIV
jgi:hypothetical protein